MVCGSAVWQDLVHVNHGESTLRPILAILLPFVAFFTIGRPIAGIICLISLPRRACNIRISNSKTSSSRNDAASIKSAQRVCKLARTGNAQTSTRLLEKGLPPNTSSQNGNTRAMLGACSGHIEAAAALLESDRVRIRRSDRGSAPDPACHYGRSAVRARAGRCAKFNGARNRKKPSFFASQGAEGLVQHTHSGQVQPLHRSALAKSGQVSGSAARRAAQPTVPLTQAQLSRRILNAD